MSVTGISRTWLQTPSPPQKDPQLATRKCEHCQTWVFGAGKLEAAERLDEHRERCHP